MPDRPAPDAEESTVGAQRPTRFAADVVYRGRAEDHDYLVRVRHRLLDTSFTVVLDGVEHDPKGEEGEHEAPPADGLRFRLEESFTGLRCTVRRPDEDGELTDAEVLVVHTAGLGGAGEVDVRHGLERTPLAPEEGSPSAARDARRLAHPVRSALLAALARAAGFLLPLLGLSALLGGLLDPVRAWISARLSPILEAIGRVVDPVRQWVAELLRPLRDLRDAVLAPVFEVLEALLQPVVSVWDRFWELVRGLLPDLAVSVPDWLFEVLVPAVVVAVVFVATFRRLRRRARRLDAARQAGASAGASDDDAGRARTRAASAAGTGGQEGLGEAEGPSLPPSSSGPS
ncbi:hypothetical protein [Brachybacterium sp. YJGR34]|uniref:hypothetical protein n=1 Tax=Brachybacterium sp. YJGR34 TaxID=2059911 RepID=UPI000E0C7912|nr:hypothetical protein [Brachybacterium sp. YJGR34]